MFVAEKFAQHLCFAFDAFLAVCVRTVQTNTASL